MVAPGNALISTWLDNSFAPSSGTSMSTPQVAGVIALMLEADNTLTPAEIKQALKSNARNLSYDENTQGAGALDAYATFTALFPGPVIQISELKLDKTTVGPGSSFTVTVTVNNWGNLAAKGVSATIILPDGLRADTLTQNISDVAVGAEKTASWSVVAQLVGSYVIKVDISSENDGGDSATTRVNVQALSVSISVPEYITEKKSAYLIVATISNLGDVSGTGVEVGTYGSSGTDWLRVQGKLPKSLGTIAPGESKEVSWSAKAITPGNYTVSAWARSDNLIPAYDRTTLIVEPDTGEKGTPLGRVLQTMSLTGQKLKNFVLSFLGIR